MLGKVVQTNYSYLVILLISICGLWLIDRRWKLVFYNNRAASLKVFAIVISLLLLFDILGVVNGIFYTNLKYVSGLYAITPNLPIEELLFLFLFCYSTLTLYIVLTKTKWFQNE